MRYFEVTAADTSVMSQIRDHGGKFVQPMHPHFSRPCTCHIGLYDLTCHIGLYGQWPYKKLQLACAQRLYIYIYINTV